MGVRTSGVTPYATTLRGIGPRQSAESDALRFETSTWVRMALEEWGSALAEPSLRVLEYDEETGEVGDPIPRHPLAQLLANPAPRVSWAYLLQAEVAWRKGIGASFLRVRHDRLGRPARLEPMFPLAIEVIPDPHTEIRGYHVWRQGMRTRETLRVDEVIHRRNFSTWSEENYWGSSVVAGLRNDLETDRRATKWNRDFFEKGAVPTVWFMPKEDVTLRERRKLRTWIKDEVTAQQKQGEPGIGPEAFDIKTLTLPHSDMQWMEQQGWTRDKTFAAFRVPAFLGGNYDSASYNGGELQQSIWYRRVGQELQSFCEVINKEVAPYFDAIHGAARVFVDQNSIETLQEPRNTRGDRIKSLYREGLITANEARERLGWGRIDDAMSDERMLPLNLSTPENAAASQGSEAPGGVGGLPRPGVEQAPQVRAYTPEQIALVRTAKAADMQGAERRLKSAATNAIRRWWEPYEKQIGRGMEPRFDLPALVDSLHSTVRAAKEAVAEEAAHRELRRMGITLDAKNFDAQGELDMRSELMERILGGYLFRNVYNVSAEIVSQLEKTLEDATREGRPLSEITAKMAEVVGAEYRGERIATTETTSALNAGQEAAYEAGGATGKGWLTTGLDNVRDTHAAQEQAPPVPIGALFTIVKGQFPGDPALPAEEAVNCHCSTYPTFDDDAKAASYLKSFTKAPSHAHTNGTAHA